MCKRGSKSDYLESFHKVMKNENSLDSIFQKPTMNNINVKIFPFCIGVAILFLFFICCLLFRKHFLHPSIININPKKFMYDFSYRTVNRRFSFVFPFVCLLPFAPPPCRCIFVVIENYTGWYKIPCNGIPF